MEKVFSARLAIDASIDRVHCSLDVLDTSARDAFGHEKLPDLVESVVDQHLHEGEFF